MNHQIPVSYQDVFRFVWSYFRRFPWHVFFAYLAITFNVVIEVMNPIVIGWITDAITVGDIAVQDRFTEVWPLVILLVGQGLFFHISYRTAHFLNCYTDSQVQKLVATEALNRVQHFETDWHVNSFAGSLVTKIKRGMLSAHVIYDVFCYNLYRTSALIIIMTLVTLFRKVELGIVFGVFSLIYAVYSVNMALKYVTPTNREENRAGNRIGAALADTIASNATVKAFSGERREQKLFEQVSSYWQSIAQKSWIRDNILALSQNLFINVLKFLVMTMAIWYWSKGVFTPGDVVFIFASYQVFSGYLSNLGDRVRELNQAINNTEDVVRFFKTPLGVEDIPKAKKLKISTGKIEFKEVRFQYPGQNKPVYQDFSLTINPGEKIALVGHSGSGKSTFVKLLQRLYDIDKGQILIDNQSIAAVTQTSLREQIALVPQDPILFHRSLVDNIAYGKPGASLKEIQKVSQYAHAHEFIRVLPEQYDTLVGERGVKLSGGERQRVAIARAMLADCPVLILDEATSSLDSESEGYIQDALAHLIKDRTAIIIAHRLSTIKSADRILVFEDGNVVEEGTHDQLVKQKSGTYKKLYELQAGGFLLD